MRVLSDKCSINQSETENTVAIPEYPRKENESDDKLRARLVYQSRKRGMLENGILLSTFVSKYFPSLTASQLKVYDKLINKPSNDWDIFHWITEAKPVPPEYDTDIMKLLQKHARNEDRQLRNQLPDIKS